MTGFFNPLARKPKPGYREAVDRIKAETRSFVSNFPTT